MSIRKRFANRLVRIGVPIFGLFITTCSIFFALTFLNCLLVLPRTDAKTFLPVIIVGLVSLCFVVLGLNLGPRFALKKGAGTLIANVLVPLEAQALESETSIKPEPVKLGPEREVKR